MQKAPYSNSNAFRETVEQCQKTGKSEIERHGTKIKRNLEVNTVTLRVSLTDSCQFDLATVYI